MKMVRNPSPREFLAIGCRLGQQVIQQIRVSGGVAVMHIYDAKTEKLIGKIKL